VSQFVHKRLPDLLVDFRLAGTDRFDIFLVKNDVGRPCRNIKDALLGCWHAVKDTRSNRLRCPGRVVGWFGEISSTRIATFSMRLRNSSGSESKASSATFTKSSRFIVHLADR
jgi:hypothetical protein